MALLGSLWDITRNATIAGGAWGGQQAQTIAHSIGQNPDTAFPVIQSVQSASAMPAVGILRANNIATLIAIGPSASAASQPTIAVDTVCILAHSIIR